MITELQPREVFVFGSNLAGVHGAGAARQALKQFGARWGVGEGPTGRCYALPTKNADIQTRTLAEIQGSVTTFLRYARDHSNERFLVTAIGCGLAGYGPRDIAPMFAGATGNVVLPEVFLRAM